MNNLKEPVTAGKNETLTLDRERVKRYLTTLQKGDSGQLEIKHELLLGYPELGYLTEALLNVCRQSMDTDLSKQFVTNLDYQRIFDLLVSLIPQSELELLENMRVKTEQRDSIDQD